MLALVPFVKCGATLSEAVSETMLSCRGDLGNHRQNTHQIQLYTYIRSDEGISSNSIIRYKSIDDPSRVRHFGSPPKKLSRLWDGLSTSWLSMGKDEELMIPKTLRYLHLKFQALPGKRAKADWRKKAAIPDLARLRKAREGEYASLDRGMLLTATAALERSTTLSACPATNCLFSFSRELLQTYFESPHKTASAEEWKCCVCTLKKERLQPDERK